MASTITSATALGTTINVVGIGGVPGGKTGVYLDGVLQSQRATPDGSGNWSVTISDVSSGSHEVRAADIVTTAYSVSVSYIPATVSVGSAVGSTTEDTTPQVIGQVTNPNGGNVSGLSIAVYYRLQGSTTWILDPGLATSDSSGNYVKDFSTVLLDGLYEFYAEVSNITVKSPTSSVTVSKPFEAPIMAPSYTNWTGANEKWGYLGNMIIGIGVPNGWEVGRVPTTNIPKPVATYSFISGDFSGLTINSSTGMITVSDTTQLTVSGIRPIGVRASNSAGFSDIIVPISIVSSVAGTTYYDNDLGNDSNAGNLPHLPKKNLPTEVTGINYFKRGSSWSGQLLMGTNPKIRAYGDPSKDRPTVIAPSGVLDAIRPAISNNKDRTNLDGIEVIDFKAVGQTRGLRTNGSGSLLVLRCVMTNVIANPDSQGMYIRNMRNGDVSIRHCEIPPNTSGDGIYMTAVGNIDGSRKVEILYCKGATPAGEYSGDNVQITSERNSSYLCYDIRMAYCEWHNDPPSASTKGNVVFEGCQRVVVEENVMTGRYFCISSISLNITLRNNDLQNADYTFDGACMLTGEQGDYGDQRWVGNLIASSNNGIGISGFKDPVDGWMRYDYEIVYNTVRKNKIAYKQNRKMSGIVQNNVFELNNATSIFPTGGAVSGGQPVPATGGDEYSTLTLTPNFLNSAQGAIPITGETVNGVIAVGMNINVSGGTYPTGSSQEIHWLINDKLVSSGSSRSYQIPSSMPADNTKVPAFMKSPTLSCFVINTDSSGNRTIVPAKFSNGRLQMTITS